MTFAIRRVLIKIEIELALYDNTISLSLTPHDFTRHMESLQLPRMLVKHACKDFRKVTFVHLQFPLSSELGVPSSSSSSSAIQLSDAWSSFFRNSAMTLCSSVTWCSACWFCSRNFLSYFSIKRFFSSRLSLRLFLYESRSTMTRFSFFSESLFSEARAAKCSWKENEFSFKKKEKKKEKAFYTKSLLLKLFNANLFRSLSREPNQ